MAAKATAIERDQLERFLTMTMDRMKSEATRASLKDSSGRPGARLVHIQNDMWEELGIPVDVGRAAITNIPENYPDDVSLISLKQQFAQEVDAAYLRCLEDRRSGNGHLKKGKMPRSTVLEFFDACNIKMDTSEVRDRLMAKIRETGSMPDSVVNEVHDEVMELLGFDKEHGQACFRDFGKSKEFAKDKEVAMAYSRWRGKTANDCLMLLNQHRLEGGELNVDDEVQGKLLEIQAKDSLDGMSTDERAQLLQNFAKKVNVVKGLPLDARKRYLDKLGDDEKLELAKAEILMTTLQQVQQQQMVQSSE